MERLRVAPGSASWLVAILLALSLLAGDARALGSAKGEDASINAVGQVWLLGAYYHAWPMPAPALTPPNDSLDDGIGAGVLRLILDGDLPHHTTYEANLYFDLSRGPASLGADTFQSASSFVTPYRTRYLAWAFWRSGSVTGELGVDRLRVEHDFGPVSLTVGRFPVNHSVTFLFTPNDFFAPFSATTLNKSYKPGVDAVRMDVGIGQLSDFEVLGVLGSDASGVPAWSQSAVTARVQTVVAGFSGSLIGGKLAERWIVGGTLQGDIKGVSLRAEGHLGLPDTEGDGHLDGPPYGQVSARIEYAWPWHNLTVGAEYAFFSDGAKAAADYLARAARFYPDELPYLGRHYVGANLGVDLIPVLSLGVVGLVNAVDGSGLTTVTLTYNAANEVDLGLGLLAGWGRRPRVASDGTLTLRSEFGTTPLAAFLQTTVSF